MKLLSSIFLLCSSWLIISCSSDGSWGERSVQNEELPMLSLVSSEQSGLTFSNTVPEDEQINILTFEYYHNGGGVAIGDLNNDGLSDVYLSGNLVPNHLYLNQGGMKFQEVAELAGATGSRGWNTGVTMVDINNDGWLDIYLCLGGQLPPENRANQLFINNGLNEDGIPTFTERAAFIGLADQGFATQSVFFDYDRDGDLDMFLLNHNVVPIEDFDPDQIRNMRDPYVGDKLYKNVGSADEPKFLDVTAESGIHENPLGYGLGVAVGDLNNDHWPDLYISNDFLEQDYLYYNNGDGTFTDQLKANMPHVSQFSMGNDMADFNNDGWLDIMVADMVAEDNYRNKTMMRGMDRSKFYYAVEDGYHYQYMINTLQMNNGTLERQGQNQQLTFSEVGQMADVSNTDWSWAPLIFDIDNDGHRDMIVTNGYKKEVSNKDYVNYEKKRMAKVEETNPAEIQRLIQDLLDSIPSTKIPNYIYRNNGNLTFSKMTEAWGFESPAFSNGAAFGDLDNDGDLDIVINNIDDNAFLYENNAAQKQVNHYLKIDLEGNEGNRLGLGAHISLEIDGQQMVHEHYLSRGFQSSVEPMVHFGLGNAQMIDKLTVRWADGKQQTLQDIDADQTLMLHYADASEQAKPKSYANQYDFKDASQAVAGIRHQENEFDDFIREVLLPHKMSTFGPALAVADVNNDGLDDFYLGGAKGFSGAIYLQSSDGKFTQSSQSTLSQHSISEDMDAIFFDADLDGDIDLYVQSGGNEYERNDAALQDRLYLNDGQGNFSHAKEALPSMLSSGGKVAPADFDQDGDLDLFIGNRQVPGMYPFSPASYLLENVGGRFEDISDKVPMLASLGMVTDAYWNDLNDDSFPDLIVAGEWMSVRVMLNRFGDGDSEVLQDVTDEAGLADSQGWWFSINGADFDQDGDIDLVAGNLGENYKYKASAEFPFEIYCADFDQSGTYDIVLGYYNEQQLFPLRGRQCSSEQMPFIKKKFPNYESFGRATLSDVYGMDNLEKALHYKAKTFSTSYIENKGISDSGIPQFELRKLDNAAQLSSVNAIVIDDYNLDGNLDMVLAGNLHASEVETPRNDASIGVLMAGDGQGNFEAVPAFKSGLHLPGDVKKIKKIKRGQQENESLLVAKNDDFLQMIDTKSGEKLLSLSKKSRGE